MKIDKLSSGIILDSRFLINCNNEIVFYSLLIGYYHFLLEFIRYYYFQQPTKTKILIQKWHHNIINYNGFTKKPINRIQKMAPPNN